MSILSHIIYWAGMILCGIGIVVYWMDVWTWDFWYPIVGVFVAAHGGFFGTLIHYIQQLKRDRDGTV